VELMATAAVVAIGDHRHGDDCVVAFGIVRSAERSPRERRSAAEVSRFARNIVVTST